MLLKKEVIFFLDRAKITNELDRKLQFSYKCFRVAGNKILTIL